MRFGLRTQLKRRWTPKGIRPPGSTRIAYVWTYLYVALSPKQGQLQAWFMPDMQQTTFQAFLDDFATTEKCLLVLDGAPAHRSKLQLPEKVKLQLLPAYAPELNPVERLFEELRKSISNKVFTRLEEVETILTQALQQYWLNPKQLIQLTFFPWMKQENNP
ncbi:endonuclease [Adhaeribacter aerolatus]|uniref:Endonuclease n=2 Tax=Adhaeribacter aerolatus TaxID=670289 RepID=A0A512B6B9_9BACT|nr:endonuclease [Adhaeribacter aerolatus]